MANIKKGTFECALVEAVGTFLVALTVFQARDPFTVGLILMAALYMGTHVHVPFFNPAVSFAEYFGKKIDLNSFLMSVGGQIVGALLAAGLSARLSDAAPMLPSEMAPYAMGLAEVITTFVYVMVVMTVLSNVDRFKNSDLYGMIIGFTATGLIILGNHMMLGMGMAYFNPAIALGLMLHNSFILGMQDSIPAMQLIGFVLVPLVGAVLAVWFHDYVEDMKK